MKKLAASTLVAVALAFLPAPAAPADLPDLGTGDLTAGVFPDDQFSALSSSGYSFAVGGGTTAGTKFAFSAHNGPKGPSGYLVVKDAVAGTAQGHVNCYLPELPNSSAEFTIDVEKASGALAGQEMLHVSVVDSGQSGQLDSITVATASVPCLGMVRLGGGAVTQGNIVVKN